PAVTNGVNSRRPAMAAQAYLIVLSVISRHCPKQVSDRIRNSVNEIVWPVINFKPRTVGLGGNIEILLVPHLGEFDQAALFTKKIDYEEPVFEWLAAQVTSNYDLVIEIGANVGVYTAFLDRLIRSEK